jgi:hypothetical protein
MRILPHYRQWLSQLRHVVVTPRSQCNRKLNALVDGHKAVQQLLKQSGEQKMTVSSTGKRKSRVPNSRGGAIVEGTVMMVLFISIAVPVTLFFVNLSFQMLYQSEVSALASNLASYASVQNRWLGLPVPGVQDNLPSSDVQTLATQMGAKLNLKNVTATLDPLDTSNPQASVYTVRVSANLVVPFRVNIFGFDLGRFFPGTVSANGVAAAAKTQPYAMVMLDGPVVSDPTQQTVERVVACLPAFGFRKDVGNSNAQATVNGIPIGTPYEVLSPTNCLSINCHNLKKEHLDLLNGDPNREFSSAYFHPAVSSSSGTVTY